MTSDDIIGDVMTNLDLGLDLWRHRVDCHLYNCGWHDESSPSIHLTMSSNNSSVPRSSSSSGKSYFYLARSSPITINPRLRWPAYPAGSPAPSTPDPESSSPELQSHLDWDPRSEVPTEIGDEVHGRYVHRFPSNCWGKLDTVKNP